MAESDATGPGPSREPESRVLTRDDLERLLEEAEREWESLSPEERARREAESEKADREAFEAIKRAAAPSLRMLENAAGQIPSEIAWAPIEPPLGIGRTDRASFADILAQIEPPARPLGREEIRAEVVEAVKEVLQQSGRGEDSPEEAATTKPPPGGSEPRSRSRPPFEADPPERLLAALRKAFPGFDPTDRWWIHVEAELKETHWRSNPKGHDAFCASYCGWGVEDLLAHLSAAGLIPKPTQPRGLSVCERLRRLHESDPDFAEMAPEREVAQRIGKRSAGSLSKSYYWSHVLKPKRAEVRIRKKMAKAAQRWGDFDSIGRPDEEAEGH